MKNKKTKGHGPGKGKKPLSTAVPTEIYEKIQHLASKSEMTVAGWSAEVVTRAAKRNEVFVLYPITFEPELQMVAEAPDPSGNLVAPQESKNGGEKTHPAITYKKNKTA